MKTVLAIVATLALAGCATTDSGSGGATSAGIVKITPLGSHDGEFCPLDRALVFEDPDGTRILYDAGRTVRGPSDPRLGKIDAILLSHVHGDHLGDLIAPSANAGTCAKPDFSVNVTPNSNMVNISLGKQAADDRRRRDGLFPERQGEVPRWRSREARAPRALRRANDGRRSDGRGGARGALQRPAPGVPAERAGAGARSRGADCVRRRARAGSCCASATA
jgi:hypothetical protein